MKWRQTLLLVLLLSCGRSRFADEGIDGGASSVEAHDAQGALDAGVADAGRNDAGSSDAGRASCAAGTLQAPSLMTFGPVITVPSEPGNLLAGVATPEGHVFAVIDASAKRVVLLGPGWSRELATTTHEVRRVRLAWAQSQLAASWQDGADVVLVLLTPTGEVVHRRVVSTGPGEHELSASFGFGTWFLVWSQMSGSRAEIWATRIYPTGEDQTLAQLLIRDLPVGLLSVGVDSMIRDGGLVTLALAQSTSLSFANSFPRTLEELSLEGSVGRGLLLETAAGVTAVYFSNGRRPDLLRVDVDGRMERTVLAPQPALFSNIDVAAATCANELAIAFTADTTGAGPCQGDYCTKPLIQAQVGEQRWHSPSLDGGYARSVAMLRDGEHLDVAWLAVESGGQAQLTVAKSLVCCGSR